MIIQLHRERNDGRKARVTFDNLDDARSHLLALAQDWRPISAGAAQSLSRNELVSINSIGGVVLVRDLI